MRRSHKDGDHSTRVGKHSNTVALVDDTDVATVLLYHWKNHLPDNYLLLLSVGHGMPEC